MISATTALKYLATSILLMIALILIVMVTFGYDAKKSLEFKTNPKDYAAIVAKRRNLPFYSFLPPTINAKAEKVAFFHQPGFLQGDDFIGLRMTLPSDVIRQELAALEESKRQEVHAADLPRLPTFPSYNIARMSRKEASTATESLPMGFRVFLFETDLEHVKKNMSHNSLAFTAVSPTTNEVVYYASQW